MAVSTYTKAGTKATTPAKLDKTIFDIELKNHELLKSAYVAHLANGRENLAKAKSRGEVSGGGRKPWRQKGTGRARFGSSRNPIWRGGGVAFGPTGDENYTHKIHKSAKRQAIRQSLSAASSEGKIIIIEDIAIKSGKTADAVKLLNKIGALKNTLLVVADKTSEIEQPFKNLSNVKIVQATYVNVFDSMNADHIVITNPALDLINEWLGKGAK
jgi:large subunit ribosomal protein L4